jgi:hypothetical protein
MKHRAKLKDVVQGRVLYKVMAFPESGESWIEEFRPTSRPFKSRFTGSMFFRYNGRFGALGSKSCMDAGIIPNRYNFHMTFTKRKAAEAYMDRINRRDFTGNEKIKYLEYTEDRRISRGIIWYG